MRLHQWLRIAVGASLLAASSIVSGQELFQGAGGGTFGTDGLASSATAYGDGAEPLDPYFAEEGKGLACSVDAMFLWRKEQPYSQTLVRQGGVEIVNGDQLTLDLTAGVRFDVVSISDSRWELGFTYFMASGAEATSVFPYDTTTRSFFGYDFTSQNTVLPTQLVAQYKSRVQNAEFNLRYDWRPRIVPFAGFRWFEIDEQFNFVERDSNPTAGVMSTTSNDLIGGQVGVDVILLQRGRNRVQAVAKGGVYYNNINVWGASHPFIMSIDDSATSFLGDLSLWWTYRLNSFAAMKVGYQCMTISRVAYAVDQNDNFGIDYNWEPSPNYLVGTPDIRNAFYQSLYVGLELTW